MKSNLFHWVTTSFVALAFIFSALSCVQEKYEISEENLNLEVTVFQEGVQIPLGNTEQLKIKDLLENFGTDESDEYLEYLKTIGADGAYALGMSETLDLSESLEELKDIQSQINIEGVSINEDISFSLASVDVSDFKIPGQEYNMDYDLGSMVGDLDVRVPALAPFKMEIKAGLDEYVPELDDFEFGLDKEPFELHMELGQLSGADRLPSDFAALVGESAYKAPIAIDPAVGMEYDNPLTGAPLLSLPPMLVELETEPYTIEMAMDLPEGISSIDNIVLKDGATITVNVAVENSLFTDGHILPHIDFDVHEIFHLTDAENAGHTSLTIDHIVDDFDIKATGANISKSYKVKSIAVSKDDVKDGKLLIHRNITLSDATRLNYSGLTTTLEKLVESAGHPMHISMSLTFEDFEIDYVELTVDQDEPVTVEAVQTIPLEMNLTLPEDVIEKIGFAKLAKTLPLSGQKKGNVHLSLSASNVREYMRLGLETLEISFPSELVVEGAANGKLSYKVGNLADGMDEYINITEIRLPEPKNGQILIDKEISVTAKAYASVYGSVNSSELAEGEDLVIEVNVESDLQFDDYEVVIKGFDHEVSESYAIEEKLPDAMKDFKGDVTVYPEGSPAIRISIVRPQINIPIVAGKGGMTIRFPELLKFEADDLAAFGNKYDGVGTLTFAEGEEVPSEIILGIDRIVVSPVTREDGIYVAGEFEVSGNIGVKAGQKVYKADVDVLAGDNPDAKMVNIIVEIPELAPSNVAVDSYTAQIEEAFEFDILSAGDVPEMIVSIGEVELDEVYIDLGIDASALIEKLGGAALRFNLDVSIPDFIIIEGVTAVPDKENNAVVISLTAEADADGQIGIDRIKVKGIDLSGVDLRKDLKGRIAVSGSATIADANIDVDDLLNSDELTLGLTGGIAGAGENGALAISKASAQVDYKLDPVNESMDLSAVREALDIEGLSYNLALSHVHLALDLKTNLGVSADADLAIIPYYGSTPAEPVTCQLSIDAPETEGEIKHTKYWLGAKAECVPEGYEFKEIPILDLLENIPDSLQISITAATDKDDVCVLDTKTDYILAVDYSFEIPLQFEEDFNIEFTYTIEDLPEVIGQIFQYGSLALTGEIVSGLPLNLDMTAELLDPSGKIVPLQDEAGKFSIKACEGIGKPSTTPVNLLFGKKKGSPESEISALRLNFKATAVNVPITEDSFLQLSLQALVPEGVTVDLNDLMGNEEK